jgi:5-methylcytosine-specific restriction endonuclease McrA
VAAPAVPDGHASDGAPAPAGRTSAASHTSAASDTSASTLLEGRSSESRKQPSLVEPLAPGRYKIQFTATAALRDKLERLQTLLSANGDPGLAEVIEAAVDEKLRRLEAKRMASATRPRATLEKTDIRPDSRRVPAAVVRTVWRRDKGQCGFVSKDGRRCTEKRRLELHHRHPFGMGGDHAVANLGLLCKPHHGYVTELDYGTNGRRAGDQPSAPAPTSWRGTTPAVRS